MKYFTIKARDGLLNWYWSPLSWWWGGGRKLPKRGGGWGGKLPNRLKTTEPFNCDWNKPSTEERRKFQFPKLCQASRITAKRS